MIGLFELILGGAAVGVGTVIYYSVNAPKEDDENNENASSGGYKRNCRKCSYFNRNDFARKHIEQDPNHPYFGQEVDSYSDTYRVYCEKTRKSYRIDSRDDVDKKCLCGTSSDPNGYYYPR